MVSSLRRAISTVRFPPGSKLIERELCDFLGVSRTLVREALRQLEAEGWVHIIPNRGPFVSAMTPDEVLEFYEVRGALEGLAAQLCAERATPTQLRAMKRAVRNIAAAQKRGDPDEQREQAAVFYDILRTAAGNAMLRRQLDALGARVAWLRTIAFSQPQRASISAQEEQVLFDAIEARDGAKARKICERHLKIAAHSIAGMVARGAASQLDTKRRD